MGVENFCTKLPKGTSLCSIIANRKSTTRFPTSYRQSAYHKQIISKVPLTHPKGGSKSEFVVFVNTIQVQSNNVCYKVALCENFQQQSCSRTIPLSNGVNTLAVYVTLQPNIQPQSDPPLSIKADFDLLMPQL